MKEPNSSKGGPESMKVGTREQEERHQRAGRGTLEQERGAGENEGRRKIAGRVTVKQEV